MPLDLYTTEKQFIKMPKLLSRIARKLGVLGGYIIIVRKNSGSIRVIESKFPSDPIIDVCCRSVFILWLLSDLISYRLMYTFLCRTTTSHRVRTVIPIRRKLLKMARLAALGENWFSVIGL
jgi:hypothetical protein